MRLRRTAPRWRSAEGGAALLTPILPASVREADRTVLVHGGRLLAALELDAPQSGPPVPTSALESLRTAPAGIVVDEIRWWVVGERPTARTVVVLALDPTVNANAIRARGGDTVGAVRMIRVVADRAAALLRPHGARLRLLDPTDADRLLRSQRCQPARSDATRTARVSAVRSRSAAGSG